MTSSPTGPAAPPKASAAHRDPRLPPTLGLGLLGALAVLVGGLGAGGILVSDPVLGDGPLSVLRYGHGHDLSVAVLYLGLGVMVWAWVRLGRDVLAGAVKGRAVLACGAAWLVPMLVAPPLFTRDAYVYLAQGALPLHGFDPYAVGPEVLPSPVTDNVHYLWQATGSPYGPLFLLLAKGAAALTGSSVIPGVILMRLALLPGLALLVWALPGLVRHLGGRTSVALWLTVANPLVATQLVGGPHNDLLMIGLLACATLLALDGRPASGMAVAGLAVAVKATATVTLPFLVLIWAARLPGSPRARIGKSAAAGIAVVLPSYLASDWALGVPLTDIPALNVPSLIVDWLSVPTGIGQLLHTIVGWVLDVDQGPFVAVSRMLGLAALLVLAARRWWAARDADDREVVRQTAIVLALAAALSPATLPWYFSWGLAMAAALAWSERGLALAVAGSVWLMAVDYPSGASALSDWPYLLALAGCGALAAVSLRHRDSSGLLGRLATVRSGT